MLSYCHSLNPPGFIGSISQQQWNCKAIARKMEQWVHLISFHKGSASLRETKLWFRTDNGNQIQWTLIIHFYYVVPINIVSSSKGLMEKSNNGAWMVRSANFFSVTLKIPETNKKLYTHTHCSTLNAVSKLYNQLGLNPRTCWGFLLNAWYLETYWDVKLVVISFLFIVSSPMLVIYLIYTTSFRNKAVLISSIFLPCNSSFPNSSSQA